MATIEAGSYVEAGDSFDTYDRGTVMSVDGDQALVAWQGAACKMEVPLADLRPWDGEDIVTDDWPYVVDARP